MKAIQTRSCKEVVVISETNWEQEEEEENKEIKMIVKKMKKIVFYL